MPTTQISKIQLRRGPASDLPGAPTTLIPLVFTASLDDGELGFTTDTGRVFVGQVNPSSNNSNFQRTTFPYQNVEVLTENSPLASILHPIMADQRLGFIAAVPLIITSTFTTLQVLDATHTAQNFNLDLPTSGVNAMIRYFVFDPSHHATRSGRMTIIWNTTMVTPPLFVDDAHTAVGVLSDIQWTATLLSSHVVLQYKNATGGTPTVWFAIDRPQIV